jgi:hypothetical protein
MKQNQTRNDTQTKPMKNGKDQIVRFNLYLPKDAYESLSRLQQLSGKRSLAETVRAALKLYHVVQQGLEDGKEVMLIDKESNIRERLVSV